MCMIFVADKYNWVYDGWCSFIDELIPYIVVFLLGQWVILHPGLFDFKPHFNKIASTWSKAWVLLLQKGPLSRLKALAKAEVGQWM